MDYFFFSLKLFGIRISLGWSGGPTTLEETSRTITHQIVDRPMSKFDVNRLVLFTLSIIVVLVLIEFFLGDMCSLSGSSIV